MKTKRWLTALLITCLLLLSTEKSKSVVWQCIIGVIVVGTGVVIAVGIKKMCDKIPPCETPPKAPNWPTNAAHRADSPYPVEFPLLELDDNGVAVFDISASTTAGADPYGFPYTRLFTTTILSTSNCVSWGTECSITGWMSSRCLLVLVADAMGVPVCTNGIELALGSGTNVVRAPIASAPMKFFRSTSYQ